MALAISNSFSPDENPSVIIVIIALGIAFCWLPPYAIFRLSLAVKHACRRLAVRRGWMAKPADFIEPNDAEKQALRLPKAPEPRVPAAVHRVSMRERIKAGKLPETKMLVATKAGDPSSSKHYAEVRHPPPALHGHGHDRTIDTRVSGKKQVYGARHGPWHHKCSHGNKGKEKEDGTRNQNETSQGSSKDNSSKRKRSSQSSAFVKPDLMTNWNPRLVLGRDMSRKDGMEKPVSGYGTGVAK